MGVAEHHSVTGQRAFLVDKLAHSHTVRLAVDAETEQILAFIAATPDSIAQLYVHVDHQGCGIGTQLLDWAKSQSNGSLWLYTFERNRTARRFYERHGFEIIERGFEEERQLPDIKYLWRR